MSRHRNGYAISRDLTSRLVEVAGLAPLGRETRKHPASQIRKLAASLDRFGFVLPILIDPRQRVVAGLGIGAGRKATRPHRSAGDKVDRPDGA
jgi:hypothetical protein